MRSFSVRRVLAAAAVTLSGCMLLSSCNLFNDRAGEEIKKSVESYMDDLGSKSFSDNGYESDYAEDTPFADLSFDDEEVQEAMNVGLREMSYEIEAIHGKSSDGKGTCDLVVTCVDIEDVLADFDGTGYDFDTLKKAIKSKDAPTKDEKITLDLVYDKGSKIWKISDTEPLTEILGNPYLDVKFGPAAGDPTVAVTAFMTALASGDADLIDSFSSYYDHTYFFNDDESEKAIQMLFYGQAKYEVLAVTADDYSAQVKLSLQLVDIQSIMNSLSTDSEFIKDVIKPILLASIRGTDEDAAYSEAMDVAAQILSDKITAADAPVLTSEGTFEMSLSEDSKSWVIDVVPAELYNIDVEYQDMSDSSYYDAVIYALEELVQEGQITQDEYNAYAASLQSPDGTSYDSASVLADIYYQGWYDYDQGSFVDSYPSSTTTLEYNLEFYNSWSGLVIYYDFYNANGSTLCFTSTTSVDEYLYAAASLVMDDGSALPSDTYKVVMYLADGTILGESDVTVG